MVSRKDSGFSLVEVMITSFILAIGLLGIVALQGIAKTSLTDTDKQIDAAFLGRTALEELRADTSWVSAASQAEAVNAILANVSAIAGRGNLAVCHYFDAGTQKITVTTSWQIQNKPTANPQADGAACGTEVINRRQISFTSFIAEGS